MTYNLTPSLPHQYSNLIISLSQSNHIPHKTLIAYNTPHQTKPITMQAYHSIDMYTTDQMIGMSYASYLYARGTINSSLNILTRASPGNPLVRFSYRNAMSLNLHLITWYVTMYWLILPSMMQDRRLELLRKYLEQVCLVLLQWFLMLYMCHRIGFKSDDQMWGIFDSNLFIPVQILSMPI